MNAKALLALIDECGMIELVNRSGRDSDGWIQETILRALRLLAAAEANDGNCPETEAAMCRYTGGEPVTFPKGLSAVVPYSFAANRIEQLKRDLAECKALADGMANMIRGFILKRVERETLDEVAAKYRKWEEDYCHRGP